MLEEVSMIVAKPHHRLCQYQEHDVRDENLLEILMEVIDVMICMYQATRPKGTSDEQKRERLQRLDYGKDKRKDVVVKLAVAWNLVAKRSCQQLDPEESDQATYLKTVVRHSAFSVPRVSSLSCSRAGSSCGDCDTSCRNCHLTAEEGLLVHSAD